MKEIKFSNEKIMILGAIGTYLYGFSILIKRNFLNIGLGLLVLASLFFIKKFNMKKMNKIQICFLILILITPIFDFLSPGGYESALVSIQKSYRFLPLFLVPIFLTTYNKIKIFMIAISCSVLINSIYVLNVYRELNWNFNIRYETLPGIQDTSHCLVGLSYVVLALIFISYKEKNKVLLLLSSFTYTFSLFIIFISKTRGAWLGLVFSMAFYLIIKLNKKTLIILCLSCLLLGGGIFSIKKEEITKSIYYERLISIKNTEASSPRIRLMLWKAAFDIWKENPIFGVGKDNSPKFYIEYFEKNKEFVEQNLPDEVSQQALFEIAEAGNTHSMYFDNLVNMGLFFFYWAGIMVYVFITQVLKALKLKLEEKDGIQFIVVLSSLGTTIAFAITGLLGSAWGGFLTRHVFLIGLILFISVNNIKENIKYE